MARYRFNWKAFLVAAAAVLALGAGVAGVHRLQRPRCAGALLARADEARAAGEAKWELRFLDRYLALNPSDAGVRFRFAQALEQAGGRALALEVYARVVADDPTRADARRRLAELLVAAGRLEEARPHLERLLEPLPGDGAEQPAIAADLLGRIHIDKGRWRPAAACFAVACAAPADEADTRRRILGLLADRLGRAHAARGDWAAAAGFGAVGAALDEADPQRRLVECHAMLAECQRRLDRAEAADGTIARMVERFGGSYRAWLLRADYRRRYRLDANGKAVADARKLTFDEEVRKAQELAPDKAEVMLAVATEAEAGGKRTVALAELGRGVEMYPQDARFYLRLAQLKAASGRPNEGLDILRRGLAAMPKSNGLTVEYLHQLLDGGDVTAARNAFDAAKANLSWEPGDRDLLEARLEAADGKWGEALKLFESARGWLPRGSPRVAMIDRLASRTAGRLGDVERQINLLRNSLALVETPEVRLEYATTLAEAGRAQEAAIEYRKLADANPPSPDACLSLARWEAARVLATAGPTGDWTEVDRLLGRAETVRPNALGTAVTRAELFAVRGGEFVNTARNILKACCKAAPAEPAPRVALVRLESLVQRADAARQALADARAALGDEPHVLRMRIALAVQLTRDKALEEIAAATAAAKPLPPEEAARVWALAASVYLQWERLDRTTDAADRGAAPRPADKSRKLLGLASDAAAQVVKLQPEYLPSQLLRFETALQAGDDETAEGAADAVRRIERSGGGRTLRRALYCDALLQTRQALAANPPNPAQVAKARRLLDEVAMWPKAAVLRADLDEREGKRDRAAENLREAFNQGERSPDVVRRLIQYYADAAKFREAYEVIQQLQQQADAVSLSDPQLFTEVLIRAAEFDRAIETALRAVGGEAGEPKNQLWLAFVYAAAGRGREAEAAFTRACDLSVAAAPWPEPWVARVQFLVADKRADDAAVVLGEIPSRVPPDQLELTLARCNEILGRAAEAKFRYAAALTADPKNRAVVRAVAEYRLRNGRFADAEPLLWRLLEPDLPGGSPQEAREVRRQLARCLAAGGDYERCKQALSVLEANRAGAAEERADVLVRAAVLAKQPGSRRAALRLYEELVAGPLPPDARYVFAQLQFATGKFAAGRAQMRRLIEQSGERPEFVETLIEALLAEQLIDSRAGDRLRNEAEDWIDRLAQSGGARWRVVEFQARVLHARGRTPEAAAKVAGYAPKDEEEALSAAGRLEEYKNSGEAEKRFKGAADRSARGVLAYAGFLARDKRTDAALTACEGLLTKLPAPLVAAAALEFLGRGQSEAVYSRVEGWLNRVEPETKDARAAESLRAQLLELRGDYPAATEAYRRLAERYPDDPFTLYFLARLFVLGGGSASEAEQFVARAIAAGGERDYLLELKGLTILRQGRPKEAAAILREAIAESPTPTAYYHLATARLAAKDRDGAGTALENAVCRRLTGDALHPLEMEEYEKTLETLKRR